MKCDLHLHSTCSDGCLTPAELVRRASKCQIECISLTDHDTMSGVLQAQQTGRELGVQVISGVEVSTVSGNQEIHMLIYGLDASSADVLADISKAEKLRNKRNELLAQKLASANMPIDLQAVIASSSGSVGRPAIAQEMVRLGYVKNVREAFDRFIGKGKPCYVQSERITPEHAIEIAHKHGGYAVLAHPKNLRMCYTQFDKFLLRLVACGLDGIESRYFSHTKSEQKFYGRMARKYHLMMTGGSDYHDNTHGIKLGERVFEPSESVVKKLGIKCNTKNQPNT